MQTGSASWSSVCWGAGCRASHGVGVPAWATSSAAVDPQDTDTASEGLAATPTPGNMEELYEVLETLGR